MMFSLRWPTARGLLVTVSALLLLCLECHAVEGRDARHFHTGDDNLSEGGGTGGGGGFWLPQRTQRTLADELEEDDAAASLRESVIQATKHSRSHIRSHAMRSRSLEDLVTPTQLTFLDLAHLYLPALTNVSQVCQRDLTALYLAIAHLDTLIKNGTLWPLKLIDSWGKFSDGLLAGNLQQLGFFKECLDIKVYQPTQALNSPQLFDHPFHPINHPPKPPDHLHEPEHPPEQPSDAPPNLVSKFQSDNSYKDPKLHQSLPLKVYEALTLPRRLLGVLPQPFLDTPEPPRLPTHSHRPPSLPPFHPRKLLPDGPLRRNTDRLKDSSVATTTTTTTTTSSPPLSLADFSGQYCLVTYALDDELQKFTKANLRTPALSAALPIALNYMAYGTCIPSTCTREELQTSLEEALWQEGLRVTTLDCQVKGRRHPLGAAEITGIVVVSLLVALMLLGTLADLLTSAPGREHFRQGPLQYLLAFSVTTNLRKIFHLETRKLPGVIPSINGIRFITITWVVLSHQYAYTPWISENTLETPELSKPTIMQIISNGDKSVDTFFMLSGLLVTLGLLGMVRRRGRFSLPFYLFHRLLRLWPPVALCTMLVATLTGLAVSGPYAEQYWSSVVKGCRHMWWADLTLTNNLIFPFLDQLSRGEGEAACCLPHTWYLGVDTQLYLLMPLLLLPLVWWPRRGWAWLLLWTAASVIVPGAIIGAYDLWPTTLLVLDSSANTEFTSKVYTMPWCRAGPYLAGAWAGYLLHYSKSNPSITRLKPWVVCIGWLAAVGVALAVIFGITPYNFVGTASQVPKMSMAEAVIYGGVHRAAWGLAVAWVIVACTWGYGGPAAWILEHPIWQPFSRLSYSIYLTSLPIQFMIYYSTKRPSYYSHYGKLQETAGVMVVTVAVSLFVSLASESPTLRLEKMMLQESRGAPRPRDPPSEVTTPPRQETRQGHENGHVTLFNGKV